MGRVKQHKGLRKTTALEHRVALLATVVDLEGEGEGRSKRGAEGKGGEGRGEEGRVGRGEWLCFHSHHPPSDSHELGTCTCEQRQ